MILLLLLFQAENKYEWDDWIKYEKESFINPFIGFWITQEMKEKGASTKT